VPPALVQWSLEVVADWRCAAGYTPYVSHIENGRVDVPEGERLDKILIAYGGITKKSFIEKIRRFRVEQTPLDDLNELIPRLTRDQLQAMIAFSMQLLQIPRFDGMTK
jgi:hypothetical protein